MRQRPGSVCADASDIVVTRGGASVGDHEIVHVILLSLVVTLDLWRINMRPGKPLMFGTRGQTLVFGLPGTPASAMVTASVFIKPAPRHCLRLAVRPPALRLPPSAPTPPNSARRHFRRSPTVPGAARPQVLPVVELGVHPTLALS
ncbi:molybdopterin-binding protein, partial [Devosia limi]|uniref:molybdopterin-binding protein n=1 Tax=Devosia limi TaxID=288995 RepID=UPI001FCD2838